MKFCTNCGEKIPDEANYCTNCDYGQLEVGDNPYRVSLVNTFRKAEAPKQVISSMREKTMNVIGAIILVTGFIALIILYLFFQEWLAILWPYIVGIVIFSWVIRLVMAGIGELIKKRNEKQVKEK